MKTTNHHKLPTQAGNLLCLTLALLAPLCCQASLDVTNTVETTRNRIVKELDAMKALRPNDLFVFYAAAHGMVDVGVYYLFTSDVGLLSSSKLKDSALDQETLKNLPANIPTTMKLIVLDTCKAQAGAVKALIGMAKKPRTRASHGMDDAAAIKRLSTAVRSTIFSAATATQNAVEGYNGHGVFTYAVAEGLKGKADVGGDGFVTTIELQGCIDEEVPKITATMANSAQQSMVQYPTCESTGNGSQVAKVTP